MLTYEEIKKLPSYQSLLDIGMEDTTSKIIARKSNLRFTHPTFGDYHPGGNWAARTSSNYIPGTLTIYSNGYVRTQFNRTPTPVKSMDKSPILTKEAWEARLIEVRQYVLRKILKEDIGVKSRVQQKRIADHDTLGETLAAALTEIPVAFMKWLMDQSETTQAGFLSAAGAEQELANLIKSNPSKYAVLLKSAYKAEPVKQAIKLLPPEMAKQFAGDIGLTGDLHSLGL